MQTAQEKFNSERILTALLDHDYITASDRALQMGVLVDMTKIDDYCMFRIPDMTFIVKGRTMFVPCDELDIAILDYALISCLFSREFN